MNQRISKNIVLAFSTVCFLFIAITLISVYNNKRFLAIGNQIQATNMLMKSMSDISMHAHDASLCAQHYFITRDKDFIIEFTDYEKQLQNVLDSLMVFNTLQPTLTKQIKNVDFSTVSFLNYVTEHLPAAKKKEDKFSLDVLIDFELKINENVKKAEHTGRTHLRKLETDNSELIVRANFYNYILAGLCLVYLVLIFVFIQQQFNKRKKAEAALRNFNERLEKKVEEKTYQLTETFDRITDAFIALDKNWCYTYVNKKAAELHKRSADMLLGKNIWDEFPDVVNEPFYDALQRAMRMQQPENVQLYYSTEDKWFEDFIYPSPNGISVYYQDITHRKKAEEQLRLSELRYRSLVEQASDGIFVASSEGFYVEVNTAGCEMLGYTRDELLTMSSKDILFTREGINKLPSRYEEMLAGKKVISENILKRKDGTPIYSETNMQMLPDGKFIGIVRNITNRKQQELALKQAHQNMKMILDNTGEGFIVIDKDLTIITFNKIAEKNAEKFLGKAIHTGVSILSLAKPERILHLKKMYDYILNGNRTSYDYVTGKLNDIDVVYRFNYTPIRCESGNVNAVMINVRDVTNENNLAQKLKQSEEQFRGAFEHSAIGMALVNTQGQWLEVNEFLCHITGYSKHELSNETIFSISMADDVQEEIALLHQLEVSHKQYSRYEKRFIHKNGNIVWAYIALSRINEKDHTIKYFIYQVEDITEQKTTALALKKSEQQYKSLFEQNPDGVFSLDMDGNFISANKTLLEYAGCSESELLHTSFIPFIAPEDVNRVMDHFNRATKGEPQHFEVNVVSVKGIKTILRVTNMPIIVDKTITGVYGIAKDISEKVKAEIELNESEKKYRLLFQNNPTPMFMLSVPGFNIVDVNDAAVKHYGYSREKFLTLNARDMRPEEEAIRFERYATNNEIQGTRYAGKWKHKTANNAIIDVEIVTHDFNYKEQLYRIVLANDVTKRMKAENELKTSHEQLRQLSNHLQSVREKERANIAREIHDELGQQLTGLRMSATRLSKKLPANEEVLNSVINNMITLIDETVATVRRISAELRPGILDDLGLTAALEWQAQEFEKRTGICCSFKSYINEPTFDKQISTGIFRVYQESLTNVTRHAKATEVQAVFEKVNGEIVLDIKDNGQGFDVKSIQQKRTLGLLGMKERANMFGGDLKVESKPGIGTVVTLKIPVFSEENPSL